MQWAGDIKHNGHAYAVCDEQWAAQPKLGVHEAVDSFLLELELGLEALELEWLGHHRWVIDEQCRLQKA